jgi:hypothetical protein
LAVDGREGPEIAARRRGTAVAEDSCMNGSNLLALSLILAAACGSVETGDPPDLADHTPDGGAPAGGPPSVVAVEPPSGSVVDEDLAIVITFSEPMDRATVEGSIDFPGAGDPTFAWNQDSTEVTASLHWPYRAGDDPAEVPPGTFEIVIDGEASDAGGAPLAGGDLTLEYRQRYRRITTSFSYLPSLTGNCFQECAGTWTWFAAGERSADPTVASRGFLTVPFDLPDGIQIERAALATEIQQVIDNPFSFGDLYIDHVQFDAINASEYNERGTGLGVLFARADAPAAGDAALHDVTDAFISDYEHRVERNHRTQYRIRFPHDLAEDPSYDAWHSDGSWDVVQMVVAATSVDVTYLLE